MATPFQIQTERKLQFYKWTMGLFFMLLVKSGQSSVSSISYEICGTPSLHEQVLESGLLDGKIQQAPRLDLGSVLAGYFDPVNQFKDVETSRKLGRHSNEVEMVYLNSNLLRVNSERAAETLAHEFTIAPPFWTQSQFYLPTSIGGVIVAAFMFLIARLVVQWRRAAALRAELRQKEEVEIQRVKKELNDAREMQMGLLPKAAPHIDEFELAGVSLPAAEVGGDFYEYLTISKSKSESESESESERKKLNLVGIALADISGKGLLGAMNAVMTNGMLQEIVQIESKAGAILSRLNTDLSSRLYGSMFVALNLGVLNPQTKQIYYANAGQRYPIIKRGQEVKEVELSGVPLGLIAETAYDEATVELLPGDFVVFYTDGLIEAMNVAEEMYGLDQLKEVIGKAPANLSAAEMIQHLLQDVHAFVGETEKYDDITVVVLRRIAA